MIYWQKIQGSHIPKEDNNGHSHRPFCSFTYTQKVLRYATHMIANENFFIAGMDIVQQKGKKLILVANNILGSNILNVSQLNYKDSYMIK